MLLHLPHYLDRAAQRRLVDRCREIGAAPAGFYRPIVRGGAKMRVDMACLGRHWNALTYRYEPVRSDFDGRPVQPLPDDLAALARRIAAEAGLAIQPDICILTHYRAEGRMGLHQDKDESPESIAAGIPIVSVSLGDTARFVVGGTRRKDPTEAIWLASGDALAMGGPSRLRYHGVTRICPGSGPPDLELEGRFNLTFRQY